ncbi:hypothetical protein V7x_48840 [Crateriforma conspicua]|uniref:Uncharacterized protein n=1 Tax=Crateriforma conspicua TaxID=2527996 RepID=A0A5C6FRN5_9PLAN|nr:hypothetical protein V7x_48840 [Crateriforma conspicua]
MVTRQPVTTRRWKASRIDGRVTRIVRSWLCLAFIRIDAPLGIASGRSNLERRLVDDLEI